MLEPTIEPGPLSVQAYVDPACEGTWAIFAVELATTAEGAVMVATGAATIDSVFVLVAEPIGFVTVRLTTTDESGRSVQTGLVGREGCVGLEALFDTEPPLPDATVQIEGAMTVIPASHLRTALEDRPRVQAAMTEFLYGLSAQSLQTIACNRLHSLEARCCRWLLTMRDKARSDNLPVTQEGLATLLGSGRPRINALLAALERDGLLRRYRGRIHIVKPGGLGKRACDCYREPSRR